MGNPVFLESLPTKLVHRQFDIPSYPQLYYWVLVFVAWFLLTAHLKACPLRLLSAFRPLVGQVFWGFVAQQEIRKLEDHPGLSRLVYRGLLPELMKVSCNTAIMFGTLAPSDGFQKVEGLIDAGGFSVAGGFDVLRKKQQHLSGFIMFYIKQVISRPSPLRSTYVRKPF